MPEFEGLFSILPTGIAGRVRAALEAQRTALTQGALAMAFTTSPWFTGPSPRSKLTPDVAVAGFAHRFHLTEDGLVALDAEGSEMLGAGGDPVPFDEAIERMLRERKDCASLLNEDADTGQRATAGADPDEPHFRTMRDRIAYVRREHERRRRD